jgi:hypothetical protein
MRGIGLWRVGVVSGVPAEMAPGPPEAP